MDVSFSQSNTSVLVQQGGCQVLVYKTNIESIALEIKTDAEDMKDWTPIDEHFISEQLVEDTKISVGLSTVELIGFNLQ